MSKVGIFKIGFVEQNEENDTWVQEELNNARGGDSVPASLRMFESIDQGVTDLIEEEVEDEQGSHYEQSLSVTVRKETDIIMARKYGNRPVVMYIYAVDGSLYKIGTKSYPTRMVISDKYQGISTREIQFKVNYKSTTRILK